MSLHFSGLGQLTMDAQTQAALQLCMDKCDSQFGVPSGSPNVFALGPCFAQCNLQFPPTAQLPGGGTVTPPPIALPAPSPTPVLDTVPPNGAEPSPPGVTPTKASIEGDMKMWVIGGVVLLAAVGAYAYSRKKR